MDHQVSTPSKGQRTGGGPKIFDSAVASGNATPSVFIWALYFVFDKCQKNMLGLCQVWMRLMPEGSRFTRARGPLSRPSSSAASTAAMIIHTIPLPCRSRLPLPGPSLANHHLHQANHRPQLLFLHNKYPPPHPPAPHTQQP